MPHASSSEGLDHLLGLVADRRDSRAFSDIYQATKARLFGTALLILRDQERAERILEKAYWRIWSQAASYRATSGSPLAWMIGITRTLALEAIKTCGDGTYQNPLPEMALRTLAAVPGQGEGLQEPQAVTREQERALSAFSALGQPGRDLIAAAYLLGESKNQLARRTGVAAEVVSGSLRSALLEIDLACRDIPAGAS